MHSVSVTKGRDKAFVRLAIECVDEAYARIVAIDFATTLGLCAIVEREERSMSDRQRYFVPVAVYDHNGREI